jgi:hypothetical protein
VKLLADGFIYAQALVCLLCARANTSDSSVNKSHVSSVYCAAQCNCILNNKIRSCINKLCITKPLILPVMCEEKSSLKQQQVVTRSDKVQKITEKQLGPIFTIISEFLNLVKRNRGSLIGIKDKYGFVNINYINNRQSHHIVQFLMC